MVASPTSRPRTGDAIAIGLDGLSRAKLAAHGRSAFPFWGACNAPTPRVAGAGRPPSEERREGRPTLACLSRFRGGLASQDLSGFGARWGPPNHKQWSS
jgi:hypothetical protein